MRSLLLLSLAAVLSSAGGHDDPNVLKPLKRPALGKLARCTGSSSCRACTNCSRCAHCSAGGSCGVCADYSAPVRTYRAPARSSSSSRRSSGGGGSSYTVPRAKVAFVAGNLYYIKASSLNLRAEPSAESEVLHVLTRNDMVTLVELTNDTWVKVTYGTLTGYLSRAYLSDDIAD